MVESGSSEKVNIAITGLNNAGKTSLVRRLTRKEFVGDSPSTLGMDVEFLKADKGYPPVQLFDLGGQSIFRKMIWANYVRLSSGVIFIFDASDATTITDSREWFWQVVSFCEENTPILFLANKWDLEKKISLDDIVEKLDLKKAAETPNRSFRVFHCSVKTDLNVTEAFEWLMEKIQSKTNNKIRLFNVYLSLPNGLPLASVSFGGVEKSAILMSSFFSAIDMLSAQVMNDEAGLESFQTESYQILMVKKENILCTLRTQVGNSKILSRNFAENIIDFARDNVKKPGKHKDQDDKLRNFICTHYPDYVPPD